MSTREATRSELRRRRALAKGESLSRARQNLKMVSRVVADAKKVIEDPAFVAIARELGCPSIPSPVSRERVTASEIGSEEEIVPGRLKEAALEFVVIWTFLFPLLDKPAIVECLELRCPGFISRLKDAFIGLVVDGPFPPTMSGHSSRRHRPPVEGGDRFV